MTGMALNQAFTPRDYEVFVGLDVDKKSFSATLVDHQMMMSRSLRMPSRADNLLAYVRYEGIPFPMAPASCQWSLRVLGELDVLACAGPVRFKLDRLLSTLRFAQEQTLQTTREIHGFCRQDPEISRCLEYVVLVQTRTAFASMLGA